MCRCFNYGSPAGLEPASIARGISASCDFSAKFRIAELEVNHDLCWFESAEKRKNKIATRLGGYFVYACAPKKHNGIFGRNCWILEDIQLHQTTSKRHK